MFFAVMQKVITIPSKENKLLNKNDNGYNYIKFKKV